MKGSEQEVIEKILQLKGYISDLEILKIKIERFEHEYGGSSYLAIDNAQIHLEKALKDYRAYLSELRGE